MTHDASHSYTYDAENRITKVDGGSTATYGYDVDGRRVSRVVAGVETDYIYDLSGRVVADYGGGCGATCWRVGYIYLNGQIVAEYFGGTYFVHSDHLGSTRLLTGYPTASVVECDDYYPFGEQVSCGGTSTTTHKFTGYERDAETGLDNAQARYNSSSLGRFMSPDPVGNFVADATNPQSWNMYAYVDNNPLIFTDPTGTEKNDEGDDTPHELPADPTAGAPVGTPNDLIWTCPSFICTVVEVDALPGDTLTSDDLSIGGGPQSVIGGGGGGRQPGKVCTGRSFGGGLSLGVNGDLGAGKAGAAVTGSVGGGLFHNSGAGSSAGAFRSGGALAYAGTNVRGSPSQGSGGSVFGIFAGGGVSLFVTNAGSVQQLSGPFSTLNFNVALGLAQLQISYAKGNGVSVLSVSGPKMGVGLGISVTTLTTGTHTTKTGCHS